MTVKVKTLPLIQNIFSLSIHHFHMKKYKLSFHTSPLSSDGAFMDIIFLAPEINWGETLTICKCIQIELIGPEDWSNVIVKAPFIGGAYTLASVVIVEQS